MSNNTNPDRSITELSCSAKRTLGVANLALLVGLFVFSSIALWLYFNAITTKTLIVGIGYQNAVLSYRFWGAIAGASLCFFAYLTLFYAWLKRLARVESAAQYARMRRAEQSTTRTTGVLSSWRNDQSFNPLNHEMGEKLTNRPRRSDRRHEL